VVFAAEQDYQRYISDLRELKDVFGVKNNRGQTTINFSVNRGLSPICFVPCLFVLFVSPICAVIYGVWDSIVNNIKGVFGAMNKFADWLYAWRLAVLCVMIVLSVFNLFSLFDDLRVFWGGVIRSDMVGAVHLCVCLKKGDYVFSWRDNKKRCFYGGEVGFCFFEFFHILRFVFY